ncbi:MTLALPHA1 [Candida jiufengensis]|uniref:MTLALPHA1 n=1 Tax=Candida jiufengensis TaxID=497108 RepID=UPI0022254794|nr:MTLALPHA1 [Candida jiufengensis]KAI5956539.1 MTLALPHA1 [Candida jiufengensis]
MGSKRPRQRKVPKEFTTLFKLSNKNNIPRANTPTLLDTGKPTFRLTSLPKIPKPSQELQQLMLDYSVLNELQWSPDISKPGKTKRSKQKPINSFIAFRSFYSRAISNPEHQRELSRKLAELWTNEQNRDTWSQYTQSYNIYLKEKNNNMTFVDWLLDSLDIKLDNSWLDSLQVDGANELASGTVEDVYL